MLFIENSRRQNFSIDLRLKSCSTKVVVRVLLTWNKQNTQPPTDGEIVRQWDFGRQKK
ncbi:MAG: hypothetical protein LH614_21150 [Pyrinomonadaceae bacterium]|nr:hypothetical protein [Pyrinomonadaceae bacterium]